MYLPFISNPSFRRLVKRKGGGGGGKGGGGKGSSGKTSSSGSSKGSSSSSSGTSSTSKTKTGSISSGKTSTYSSPNTSPRLIPAGQPFAGRTEGGASRAQIFGTRTYGSGYPGLIGRGVSGRAFPFYYWPIVWPVTAVIGLSAADALYLHDEQEYGSPTNSTRPGGAQAYATFPSASSSPPNVVFRVLADNDTVISLISDLKANCSTYFSNSSFAPPNGLSNTSTPYAPPYTFSNTTGPANPQPEQVVQYYRGSTIALTLDSYNNTATYSADGTPDSPLPILGTTDVALLNCLNTTIGLAAPLVSPAGQTVHIPAPLLYVIWTIFLLLAIVLG